MLRNHSLLFIREVIDDFLLPSRDFWGLFFLEVLAAIGTLGEEGDVDFFSVGFRLGCAAFFLSLGCEEELPLLGEYLSSLA